MYVGIDIGGTSIKGVLTNGNGKVLSFLSTGTPGEPPLIVEAIYSLIENLATTASVSKMDIKAAGVGAAGTIDRKKGIVITSPNIPCWHNYPLVKNLSKRTGMTVYLENDATAALAGSWWQGNGMRYRNWIMLTLGTGIGGGVIIDGKIYTGQSGSSMEAGHMTIEKDGRPCPCGNRGCLERYASATALVEYAEEGLKKRKNSGSSLKKRPGEEPLTGEIIFEEAEKGDAFAREALEEMGHCLGIGIANLVNLFNPEAVILGGGLSMAHRYLIPQVKKVVGERALKGCKEKVKFLPIKDQEKIPALGAARIAMDALNIKSA